MHACEFCFDRKIHWSFGKLTFMFLVAIHKVREPDVRHTSVCSFFIMFRFVYFSFIFSLPKWNSLFVMWNCQNEFVCALLLFKLIFTFLLVSRTFFYPKRIIFWTKRENDSAFLRSFHHFGKHAWGFVLRSIITRITFPQNSCILPVAVVCFRFLTVCYE